MTQLQLGFGWVLVLALLPGNALADEPKQPATHSVKALINKLVDVAEPDTGYSGSVSGTAFLPLGRSEAHTMLLGQRPHAESDAMRSLVKLGVKAVPALLDHLSDDRLTKIVIEHSGIVGGFSSSGQGREGGGKVRRRVSGPDPVHRAGGRPVLRGARPDRQPRVHGRPLPADGESFTSPACPRASSSARS